LFFDNEVDSHIREIYEQSRDQDEFLYITYAELETFGSGSEEKN